MLKPLSARQPKRVNLSLSIGERPGASRATISKGQIIQHPAFETDTEKWVKIYIDGDSLGAQAWGEKFGIINYPTVLLLDPNATERQRFSEVIRYADFKARLSRAQGEAVDFENLVQRALTGEATEAEWNAVAQGARDHYQLTGLYDTSLLAKLIPVHKRCPRLESIDCDVLAYAVITAALKPLHTANEALTLSRHSVAASLEPARKLIRNGHPLRITFPVYSRESPHASRTL